MKTVEKYGYPILFGLCILTALFNAFPEWQKSFDSPNQFLLLLGSVIIIISFFVYYFTVGNKKFGTEEALVLILAFGFLIRLIYCQSTDHSIRQHDVIDKNGHLDYIYRFVNGEGLPETKSWQYYQPPAWHYLCSVFIRIQNFFGIASENAVENLQHVSLFCSSAVMLLSHNLFKMLGLEKTPLCIATAIISFHPAFIILSGSLNNDILSITLALSAVVLGLKWYRDPKFSTIIFLALAIGISMAAKLSAGIISIGVAMLFAIRLFGNKYKNKLKLIAQYIVFGIMCVPVALWWPIRNMIRYDVPLTYVPLLSKKLDQYLGEYTVSERLFDISSLWEYGVYPARGEEGEIFFEGYDFNIPVTILKTSVFGEFYVGANSEFLYKVANILFYSAAVLAVISVVSAVYIIIKLIKEKYKSQQKKEYITEILYIAVCASVLVGSYVKFCFDYPHFCTMNFRYIALSLVFGALYLGLLAKYLKNNNKIYDKVIFYTVLVLTILMAVSSFMIYGSIA